VISIHSFRSVGAAATSLLLSLVRAELDSSPPPHLVPQGGYEACCSPRIPTPPHSPPTDAASTIVGPHLVAACSECLMRWHVWFKKQFTPYGCVI